MVREMIGEGHTVVISVKGRSMRPFLEDERDKVKLSACLVPQDYDAVLAEDTPGHFVLHRIVGIDGDNITLQGDGNVRGQEHCTRADIIGVVTEYIYPRRTVKASSLPLRLAIRLWRKLAPVRRYLLYIYRKILTI